MNPTQVQTYIIETANRLGVDAALALAVAKQESAFNQAARSRVGAIGVFQLMPKTAAGLGVDPTVVAENIRGGVTYLAQLGTQYNGDTASILAAYNAGPGNVAKYHGVPPFPETRDYVSRVTASQGHFAVQLAAARSVPVAGPVVVASLETSETVVPVKEILAGVLVGGLLSLLVS